MCVDSEPGEAAVWVDSQKRRPCGESALCVAAWVMWSLDGQPSTCDLLSWGAVSGQTGFAGQQ